MNGPGAATSFDRLLEVIAALRTHCPWMGELTHESLMEYLIEESYEVVDAVEDRHPDSELAGELGDVLLQVVLHARLAEELGRFDVQDVVEGLTAKMVRRNPHVFRPDGSLQESFPATVDEIIDRWHAVKKREKPERTSPFDGIPQHLPALALAAKTLKRADRVGVASSSLRVASSGRSGEAECAPVASAREAVQPGSAREPVRQSRSAREAVQPLSAWEPDPMPSTEAELGDFLLETVGRAVANGLDSERALRAAVRRFQMASTGVD